MIGPPDPLSNLRPVAYHVPRNEQEIEKAYRVRREEVQKWNEAFWRKHNESFITVQSRTSMAFLMFPQLVQWLLIDLSLITRTLSMILSFSKQHFGILMFPSSDV